MKRPCLAAACVAAALIGTAPAAAQWTGVLGFDGVVSNRTENAFGTGLTLAYGHSALAWNIGGLFNLSIKAFGAGDTEFVTGALEPGYCYGVGGDRFYYRECAPPHDAVPPSLAEAPSPVRLYLAGYGVVDAWRVRLGLGYLGHPGAGDAEFGWLVGFAASTTSWLMLERAHDGWRFRVQMAIAGPKYLWK